MKKIRRFLIVAVVSLLGVCLLTVVISALSNLGLPQSSPVVDRLSEDDKIRLAEYTHLRNSLGDEVWPGWGQADIPIIFYNETYAFLTGLPDPPAGWVKVPSGTKRGGEWEVVPGDTFSSQSYYRQALTAPNLSPEAFTVQVGDRWVASLQTMDWARISLMSPIRDGLPGFLRPVFPYRLFIGQLLGGSDKYITLLAHEAFHAYQGMFVPERLAAAEDTNSQYANQYPWEDLSLQSGWQSELDLLSEALQTSDRSRLIELTREFLAGRSARRGSAGLSQGLIEYERQREWLEGLARYAELEVWRQAARRPYTPLPESAGLDDFKHFKGFDKRWSQEIQQIRRMADDTGDGRFYYTGMAQAYLLDHIMPDWKSTAFEEGVWLEGLLSKAVLGEE